MIHTRHTQFPQEDILVYFNHAAVAPLPQVTAMAIQQFAEECMHFGSKNYLHWIEMIEQCRELCRWLVNAESADDIALVKNTSEGLSFIAYGLDWNTGDNIVIPSGEFPSNRIVWQSLKRFGVETREVDIRGAESAEQALIDACDENTRLMSVSAVQYADGYRMHLQKLGQFCHANDVLFVVDAIQQLGALKFDVNDIQADFVVADGHKWMLGLEGLALFYVRPELRDRLSISQYGWHMVENAGDFSIKDWKVSDKADRFECGSPNTLASIALHASLSLLQQTGIETIEKTLLENSRAIIDFIKQTNYSLISSEQDDRLSGIITFRHNELDNKSLFNILKQDQILCAERGGGIRVSPHYYHQEWEFDRFFNILSTL